MYKKLLSMFLSLNIICGFVNIPFVYAEETGEIFDETTLEVDNETIVTEHIETVPAELVNPEDLEEDDETYINTRETHGNPLTRSSLIESNNTLWNELMGVQFGDEFFRPYEACKEESVSENTNKLKFSVTDLYLPGKNGLDLNIRRVYDNQQTSHYAAQKMDDLYKCSSLRRVFAFTREDTNKTVYIAFHTIDEFYEYMYAGCRLSEFDADYFVANEENIYLFDDIYTKIDPNGTIRLTYDSSIESFYAKYKEETRYELINVDLNYKINSIGYGWSFEFPYSTTICDAYTREKSTSYIERDKDFSGTFRDINGVLHTYTANHVTKQINSTGEIIFTSSYSPDNEDKLLYERYYLEQELDDGTLYNFKITDERENLVYYMYATTAVMANNQKVRLVQIRDDYNNKITFNYSTDTTIYANQIIDTYGREINVSSEGISYSEIPGGEIKNITYTLQTLPPETLDNDSIIKQKDVCRLIVTNENGEQTIYDSRETEMTTGFGSSSTVQIGRPNYLPSVPTETISGYNIERIIYPTGMEKHYRYTDMYIGSSGLKTVRSLYAVESSYEKYGDEIINEKTYSIDEALTRDVEEIFSGGKHIREYDSKGRLTADYIRTEDSSAKLTGTTYSYKTSNDLSSLTNYTDGNSVSTSYTYIRRSLPSTETTGNKKLQYSYYDDTAMPTNVKVYNKSGSSFVLDYTVKNEISDEHLKILSTTIVKDNNEISKTAYEYDEYGNIMSQKEWVSDSNSDGNLDESDEYIESKRITTVDGDLLVTVKDYIQDVRDIDGLDVCDISYEYKYNIFGSPIYQKDSYGNITSVEYDVLNRPVKYTYPNGAVRTVEYSMPEMSVTVTDENGVKTKQLYNAFGSQTDVLKLYNEQWKPVSKSEYNDALGRVTKHTQYTGDNIGTVTDYTYDAINRPLTETVSNLSGKHLYTNTYVYSKVSSNNKTQKKTAFDGKTSIINQYHDNLGNLIKEEVSDGSDTYSKQYTYDYQNRLLTATDEKGNTTTNTYDTLGNLTSVKDALNNTVVNTYDMLGRNTSVTNQNGDTTSIGYDVMGREIYTISPEGATTKNYYDKNSRLIKQAIKDSKPDDEYFSYAVTETKYDNMGNVIAVISENGENDRVTQYTYNLSGKLTKMITGLTSYSENPTGGNTVTYSYDDMGRLSQITDPLGQSESYTYDYLDNLLTKTDRNGVVTTNTYSASGIIQSTAGTIETNYNYDSIGQLTGVSTQNSTVNYEYDSFGRKISETADGYTKNYTYDELSNITEFTLLNGDNTENTVSYTYDALNRLTNMTGGDIITSYEYDAVGNLTGKTSGAFSTSYTYDGDGNLTGLSNSYNSVPYQNYTYAYRYDGNRYLETGNGVTKSYTYDKLGQLTNETIMQNDGSTSYDYAYDSRGNRISMLAGDVQTNYEYDSNNRLLAYYDSETGFGKRYNYDNNGNQIFEIDWQKTDDKEYAPGFELVENVDYKMYCYDELNRLTRSFCADGPTLYSYYADGTRKLKTGYLNSAGYVWSNGNMIAETLGNEISTLYNYDVTGIANAETETGTQYYSKNGHGDVTGVYSPDGTAVSNYLYDAFGNQLTENANDTNPFRYCGEYFDSETQNIYLRNRYYNPEIGRFITEDPIRDGLNWYAYCANNPVMYIDPFGEEYLVVSGSEEDGRYKYNFVETAIKKIIDLKSLNDGEWITWIVSETAYSEHALQSMNDIAYDLGVGFVKISSASEFQNYVNSKDTSMWNLSENRINDPITKVTFFSHGVKGAVELGYGQPNRSQLSINKKIVEGIFSEAFDSPNTWFYSCNGSTGGEQSIAKQWYNVASGYTGGYIGKTTYEYIMYPKDYSSIKKIFSKKMRQIDKSIDERRSELEFSKTGCDYYPIPSDGTSLYTWGGI